MIKLLDGKAPSFFLYQNSSFFRITEETEVSEVTLFTHDCFTYDCSEAFPSTLEANSHYKGSGDLVEYDLFSLARKKQNLVALEVKRVKQ